MISPFDDDPLSAPSSVETAPAPVPARSARETVRTPARGKVRKGESEAEELTAPVRLLGLEILGYKRIRAVQFEVAESGVTVIGGGNAQGKSSSLEAITCLLGGARFVPDIPVHETDPRATIVGDISDADGRRYRIKRVINPDRTGFLEITREDGSVVGRAQEFLDAMKGVLWFDPCAFLRQPAKEQAETLRRLVGLDFTEIDTRRRETFEQRTVVGRERDRAKGHAESMQFYAEAPEEEITPTELAAQMQEATAHNQALLEKQGKLSAAREKLRRMDAGTSEIVNDCVRIRQQISELTQKLDRREADLEQAQSDHRAYEAKVEAYADTLAGEYPIDITAIAEQMTDVDRLNRQVRANQERAKAFEKHGLLHETYEDLTGEISGIDDEKRRQLAAVSMPVPGLGFDSEGVTVMFGDYPLPQASGAEQIRVAVAMAMLMSGGLKVALVDEGEKLDLKQLAVLDRSVREAGGQVVMARVSMGDECAIVIENGVVAEKAVAR